MLRQECKSMISMVGSMSPRSMAYGPTSFGCATPIKHTKARMYECRFLRLCHHALICVYAVIQLLRGIIKFTECMQQVSRYAMP